MALIKIREGTLEIEVLTNNGKMILQAIFDREEYEGTEIEFWEKDNVQGRIELTETGARIIKLTPSG